MSKQTASTPEPPLESGLEPELSLMEQMEVRVWSKESQREQIQELALLLDFHLGGVCRSTIFCEEVFLFLSYCREKEIIGHRAQLAFDAFNLLFDGIERGDDLESSFNAFSKKLLSASIEGEEATKIAAEKSEVETEEAESEEQGPEFLSQDQAKLVFEFVSKWIFPEYSLYRKVWQNEMAQEYVRAAMRLETVSMPEAPLNEAKVSEIPDPAQQEEEQRRLDQIMQRMVEIEIKKAERSVEQYVKEHECKLQQSLEAIQADMRSL